MSQLIKANRILSVQTRFHEGGSNSFAATMGYDPITGWIANRVKCPIYGDPLRDTYLSTFWKQEPILAGAINVMVKRMRSTGYVIEGGKSNAIKWARILQDADGGNGWANFIAKWVQDYITTDLGAIIEIGSRSQDRPAAIYNMDSLRCYPWRDYKYPLVYTDSEGKLKKLPRESIIHISDMTSPREQHYNKGFCAVSRLLKAGETILAIYEYELQKLGKLPPLAIGKINGMTHEQFTESWEKYKIQRQQEGIDVFSGIFWIGGDDPSVPVDVTLEDISKLPDQFDRTGMMESWVKNIALNLGVDVGELWLITHVGATKASQSVQHQKALGKGTGEIHSMLEMALNTRVLPADVVFQFDFQDDAQDMQAAEILTTKINNLLALYTQSSRGPANFGGLEAPFGRSGAGTVTDDPEGKPQTNPTGLADATPPLIDRNQAIELGTKWGIFPAGFFGQEVTTVAGMILKKAGLYRSDDLVRVTHDMKIYSLDEFSKQKHYKEASRLLLSRLSESQADHLLTGDLREKIEYLSQ